MREPVEFFMCLRLSDREKIVRAFKNDDLDGWCVHDWDYNEPFADQSSRCKG